MPDVNSIVGGTLIGTLAIVAFSIIVTIVILIVVFRFARKAMGTDAASQQLLATGVPAQAKIVQVQETGTIINGMPIMNILLEVMPSNGQPPFQVWVRRRIAAYQIMQFQLGGIVPVRYDAADPTKVAIAL